MRMIGDGYALVCGLMIVGLSTTSTPAATGLDEQGQLKSVLTATGSGFGYRSLGNGVQVCVNGVFKNVIFHGPETVRVNANLGQPHTIQPSLVVVAPDVGRAQAGT